MTAIHIIIDTKHSKRNSQHQNIPLATPCGVQNRITLRKPVPRRAEIPD